MSKSKKRGGDCSDGEFEVADFALKRISQDISKCNEAVAYHTRARIKDERDQDADTAGFQQFLASLMGRATENWMDEERSSVAHTSTEQEKKVIDTLNHECCALSMRVMHPFRFDSEALVGSEQRRRIAEQWRMLIQLSLTVRLICTDREKQEEAYQTSAAILKKVDELATQTRRVRAQTREFDSVFVAVPPSMNVQSLRGLAQETDEDLIQKGWNVDWFPERKVLLGFCGLYPLKKAASNRFSQIELTLLKRGLLEFSTFVEEVWPLDSTTSVQRGRPTLLSGDWLRLQQRFLPHRSLVSLQNKMSRLRSRMELGSKTDFKSEFRQREPASQMTEEQLSVLSTGVRMFGENSWSRIARHFSMPLHSLTTYQLKKQWHRDGKPRRDAAIRKARKRAQTEFYDPSCPRGTSDDGYAQLVSDLTDSDVRLFKSLLE